MDYDQEILGSSEDRRSLDPGQIVGGTAMTGITENGIEIDREIAAPPALVFEALTRSEMFARWFGGGEVEVPFDRLDYHAEVGKKWVATMVLPDGDTIDWAGKFLEVDPPFHLLMTITDQPPEDNASQLAYDLTTTATGTHLRVSQETPGFTEEEQLATIAGTQTFLDVLVEIVEG